MIVHHVLITTKFSEYGYDLRIKGQDQIFLNELKNWYCQICLRPPVIFLLIVPRRCFFCGSLSVICVPRLFLSYCLIYSLQPCVHLLENICPLVCDVFLCFCNFPVCPRPGVVQDCNDSGSLPSSLLLLLKTQTPLSFFDRVFIFSTNIYNSVDSVSLFSRY